MINRYSKIWNVWSPEFKALMGRKVVVQEKYDGSQISWRVRPFSEPFEDSDILEIRSKNCLIDLDNVPKIFQPSVKTIIDLFENAKLIRGFTYRGEAFQSNKHNTLQYNRVPWGNLVLFDVEDEEGCYYMPSYVAKIAHDLGIDCAHTLNTSAVLCDTSLKEYDEMIHKIESSLGGRIEGLVFKDYGQYDSQGKCLMGKLVDSEFRERHKKEFPKSDIITQLIGDVNKERLWEKAIQSLRDFGCLTDSMKDIPEIMKEVHTNFLDEESERLKEKLWRIYWKKINKYLTQGMPIWYNEQLKSQILEN